MSRRSRRFRPTHSLPLFTSYDPSRCPTWLRILREASGPGILDPKRDDPPGPEHVKLMGLRLACTTKKDERPKGGETWLPLSFGLMDLALALRKAGFLEGFVEKAVLVFIRANPLDLR